MVDEYKEVKEIIASEAYRAAVLEMIGFLKINVDCNYEEVFAKLDSAKLERAGVNKSEVQHALESEIEHIKRYSVNKHRALHGLPDEQEYPAGEEPDEGEKDAVLSIGNYAQGFLLTNVVEYMLAKEGAVRLQEYFKLSRMPKAKEYSRQVLDWVDEQPS